jgi:hypothetical protein
MKKRKKVGKDKDIAIWGPVDPPEKLGYPLGFQVIDVRFTRPTL